MLCHQLSLALRALIPDRPDITLGRIWKYYDKVKKFYFILGFGYGSGVLMGALD